MIVRNKIITVIELLISLTFMLLNPICSASAQESEPSPTEIRAMLPQLNEYVQTHPTDVKSYAYRGWVYSKLQEFQKSIDDLSKAIELDPKNTKLYLSRGSVYLQNKEFLKAISDNSIAIRLDPKNPFAYANRSASYLGLCIYKNALQDALMSIRLDSSQGGSYDNAGEACYKSGKYDEAISYYNQALNRDSKLADAFFFRGMCYQKLGNKVQGNKDLLRANELGYKPDGLSLRSVDLKE